MESMGLILGATLPAPPRRRPDRRHLDASSPISNEGSVGLAVQEDRDVENLFLGRIAHRSGAAERIEALRRYRAHIFRDRRPGLARRRDERRRTGVLRRRYAVGDAAPVV